MSYPHTLLARRSLPPKLSFFSSEVCCVSCHTCCWRDVYLKQTDMMHRPRDASSHATESGYGEIIGPAATLGLYHPSGAGAGPVFFGGGGRGGRFSVCSVTSNMIPVLVRHACTHDNTTVPVPHIRWHWLKNVWHTPSQQYACNRGLVQQQRRRRGGRCRR